MTRNLRTHWRNRWQCQYIIYVYVHIYIGRYLKDFIKGILFYMRQYYLPILLIYIFFFNLQTGSKKRGRAAAPWADKPSLPSYAYVARRIHREGNPTRRLARIRCYPAPCHGSWRRAAPNSDAPPRMQFRAATSRSAKCQWGGKALITRLVEQIKKPRSLCQPSAIKSSGWSTAREASNCIADVI